MRHIALKVKDAARAKEFYCRLFHEVPKEFSQGAAEMQLDHLGFVVESIGRVKELERDFISQGVKIVHPFKIHRDGSASFYCADPDGIVIQMLYEPQLSSQRIS